MNRVKATACKPNDMDYFCEKDSISHCEKKCLAFQGSVQVHPNRDRKFIYIQSNDYFKLLNLTKVGSFREIIRT